MCVKFMYVGHELRSRLQEQNVSVCVTVLALDLKCLGLELHFRFAVTSSECPGQVDNLYQGRRVSVEIRGSNNRVIRA